MTNEIVPVNTSIIRTYDDAERAARAMAASGFFADSRQASQAVVKILAGQELGFGPFASMTGVHIIQNKPVLAANLMAAAVKRTGKYNYRVLRLDDTGCEIAFLEGGQEVGRSVFDAEDAKKAGLLSRDNWQKYPRNMYFARALSNGQKWYAPDVFGGATVYTPDELGAPVDEEGNAVAMLIKEEVDEDLDARGSEAPIPWAPDKPTPKPAAPSTPAGQLERPLTPAVLRSFLATKASRYGEYAASPEQVGLMVGMMEEAFAPNKDADKIRRSCLRYLWDVGSSKELSGAEVKATLDWLKPVKDSGGAYHIDLMAEKELHAVWTAAQHEKGQEDLPGSNNS